MSTNYIERTRLAHEIIDRTEAIICEDLVQNIRLQKDRMMREHLVCKYIQQIQTTAKDLLVTYQDEEGHLANEKASMALEFTEFYNRLKNIKDFHRRAPNQVAEPLELSIIIQNPEEEETEALFSGEEHFGKYLDLNAFHGQYLNLKNAKKNTYLQYIDQFSQFDSIPKETRASNDYFKYLEALSDYLRGFITRSRPLFNIHELDMKIDLGFTKQWMSNHSETSDYYCIPCMKHFSKQTVFEAHKTGKKHLKAVSEYEKNPEKYDQLAQQANKNNHSSRMKQIEKHEFIITKYLELLKSVREDTRAFVNSKLLMTERERELQQEEDEEVDVEALNDSNNVEEKFHNPLNLPLGWDGKPIPFWLYKLHGLGIEYPCEICGNFVYMGRKAFDNHFREWRHVFGLRCLGIPNNKHFQDVTSISDAYALWERLKVRFATEGFNADVMEEFEDQEGNVFNKKTYEDLKRQGLI